MSMVPCPECGVAVSDQAMACPRCGYPVAARMNRPGLAAGAGLPSGAMSEVRTALLNGNKIEAIKAYRQATGLGLYEAKNAVDQIEQEMSQAGMIPGRPTAGSSAATFIIAALVLLCILAGMAVWMFRH